MQWPTTTLLSQFPAFVELSERYVIAPTQTGWPEFFCLVYRCASYDSVSNHATVAKVVELLQLTAFSRDWNADCKLLKFSEALIRRNSQVSEVRCSPCSFI